MEKKGGGGLFGGCRWRVADRPDRVPAGGLQAAHGFGDVPVPAAVGEHRAGRCCGVEGPGTRFPRVARQDALPPVPHTRDPADPGPGDRSGTGGRDTGPALSGPAVRPVDIPVALPVRFPVDAAGGVVGFRRVGPAGEHTGRALSFGARARGGAHRMQGTGCDGPAADVAPFRQTVHRGQFPATGAPVLSLGHRCNLRIRDAKHPPRVDLSGQRTPKAAGFRFA